VHRISIISYFHWTEVDFVAEGEFLLIDTGLRKVWWIACISISRPTPKWWRPNDLWTFRSFVSLPLDVSPLVSK